MEFNVDIDERLLSEFDRAVRAHDITRSAAVRGAITAWLSQARRDAALRKLFDADFHPESCATDRSASEKSS
jgi:metal-responsive CopG/Arc/MetJ family transcriptional regulator